MARLKLPAMMFYFGDWFKATDVRGCSLAARGLWIDLLGIMWEGDNPGYLESNGAPLNATFIGRVIGEDKGTIETHLAELETAGVFSKDERGVIYCRRMVKDVHKRLSCSEAGKRGGGNPHLKTFKGTPKGRVKGVPEYEDEDVNRDVDRIYRLWPTKTSKRPRVGRSLKDKDKIRKILREGKYPLEKSVVLYLENNDWPKDLSTFLNQLPDIEEQAPKETLEQRLLRERDERNAR
jgi:hypothetical protein